MAFKELPLGEVSLNPFTKLDKEWGLVAAGDAGASNAMTPFAVTDKREEQSLK